MRSAYISGLATGASLGVVWAVFCLSTRVPTHPPQPLQQEPAKPEMGRLVEVIPLERPPLDMAA